jgi:hypothetical protein
MGRYSKEPMGEDPPHRSLHIRKPCQIADNAVSLTPPHSIPSYNRAFRELLPWRPSVPASPYPRLCVLPLTPLDLLLQPTCGETQTVRTTVIFWLRSGATIASKIWLAASFVLRHV